MFHIASAILGDDFRTKPGMSTLASSEILQRNPATGACRFLVLPSPPRPVEPRFSPVMPIQPTNDRVMSFAPVANEAARIVILGSMPGVRSLEMQQYYAHPRNSFWKIMAAILGFDANEPYEARLRHLVDHGIALWDVLQSCERPGSLDSSIASGTRVPNDFSCFFGKHAPIDRVCFNGGEAHRVFSRMVLPSLPSPPAALVQLPSTSPAHAAMSFEQKVRAWTRGLDISGKSTR